jgi:hypothetical protein
MDRLSDAGAEYRPLCTPSKQLFLLPNLGFCRDSEKSGNAFAVM